MNIWSTENGVQTKNLINNIEEQKLGGATNIYLAASKALQILDEEDLDNYNASIILMTDGESNVGSINDLKSIYRSLGKDIPIYSIMFGSASSYQLEDIATLTNAKVFDGRTNLLEAFKQVRAYN